MRTHRVSILLVPVCLVGAAACNNSTGLPAPAFENTVDTVSLYALDGTPVTLPSGFSISSNQTRRTDQSTDIDFIFTITPAGQAVLEPTGAIGLGIASGIQVQSQPFDGITIAPTTAYVDTLPVPVDTGSVLVVHSRPVSTCIVGIVYYYGKVHVLAIDTLARRIDLETLVDQNCGYRGLEPGLPTR
jgi:hypothetical protein